MKPCLRILVALLSTASVGLAQAPRAAIVTGEVHNPPSRDVAFHHEPLLAPGPSKPNSTPSLPDRVFQYHTPRLSRRIWR